MSTDRKYRYVAFTKLPRPDHPHERQPLVLRTDLIGMIQLAPFNYTPDDKAAVAILPTNKALRGEATAVSTVTGNEFFVVESVVDVYRKIRAAEDGEPAFPAVVA